MYAVEGTAERLPRNPENPPSDAARLCKRYHAIDARTQIPETRSRNSGIYECPNNFASKLSLLHNQKKAMPHRLRLLNGNVIVHHCLERAYHVKKQACPAQKGAESILRNRQRPRQSEIEALFGWDEHACRQSTRLRP